MIVFIIKMQSLIAVKSRKRKKREKLGDKRNKNRRDHMTDRKGAKTLRTVVVELNESMKVLRSERTTYKHKVWEKSSNYGL